MTITDPHIQAIIERNARVETDKAWETSMTRRLCIAVMTYLTAAAFLWWTGTARPFAAALFPPAGYLLSTLSLPWIKSCWVRRRERQNGAM